MPIRKVLLMFLFLGILILSFPASSAAQCSICTRTAQQLGEKPARGLNAGILYLAFTPLALAGIIGFRWWLRNRSAQS